MSVDEYREFARQQQLRFERMMREFVRELRESRAGFGGSVDALRKTSADMARKPDEMARKTDARELKTADMARKTDKLAEQNDRAERHLLVVEARTRDLLEESRAQRQALLAILDRMNGGGAAPAT